MSDTSDHFPTMLKIDLQVKTYKTENRQCRDTKNFDITAYYNDTKRRLTWWNERLISNPNYNINNTLKLQIKIVDETINKHAPLRNMSRSEKKRFNKPWLTRGILISINTRQKH